MSAADALLAGSIAGSLASMAIHATARDPEPPVIVLQQPPPPPSPPRVPTEAEIALLTAFAPVVRRPSSIAVSLSL